MKDLTTPRFEVIADYPNSPFKVGEILTAYSDTHCKKDGNIVGYEIELTIKPYPNIFRPMLWWEKRELSEMPEYLIVIKETINGRKWKGVIIKCGEEIFWNSNQFSFDESGFVSAYGGIVIYCFAPATKEEYEAYLKQTQK